MISSEYGLHSKLILSLRATRRVYHDYFRNEYLSVSRIPTDGDATKVSVSIVCHLPEAIEGDRIRHVTSKKIFTHHYLIRGFGTSHVEIYFKDSAWGWVYAKIVMLFLQAQIIEPVIYDALLRRGVYFIHAAGMSDGTHGYVFAAHGGTGKTSLTMALMGEGLAVLGDDLLMVDSQNGTVGPYLRPLHIFTYNVKTLRGANISWRYRIKVKVKDILRVILELITRQEFLISTRIHAAALYPDFRVGSVVPIKRILFLVREGEDSTVSLSPNTIRDVALQILDSADLNKSLYTNVLKPDEIGSYQEQELTLITTILGLVSQIHFINTRKRDLTKLGDFAKWLAKP